MRRSVKRWLPQVTACWELLRIERAAGWAAAKHSVDRPVRYAA